MVKNKLISVSVCLLSSFFLLAKDIIVLNTGETMNVYNVEVGDKYVYYTNDSDINSQISRISIQDVFSVKIGDGKMQTIGVENTKTEKTDKNESVETNNQKYIDKPVSSDNIDHLLLYNRQHGGSAFKEDKKEADRAIAFYAISPTSTLSNEDISVSFELSYHNSYKEFSLVGGYLDMIHFANFDHEFFDEYKEDNGIYKEWHSYDIFIKNKTDKNIYIDLENVFKIFPSGSYQTYYDGSSTVTTTGQSSGISFNLGAAANAFGIGGIAGTLLGGTTIGNNSGNSISNITTSKRVIIIPPKGEALIPRINKDCRGFYYNERYDFDISKNELSKNIKRWESVYFNEDDSPRKFKYIISYSTSSDFSTWSKVEISIYVNEMMGAKGKFWGGYINGMDKHTLCGQVFIND